MNNRRLYPQELTINQNANNLANTEARRKTRNQAK
jgi:hypothetical protein